MIKRGTRQKGDRKPASYLAVVITGFSRKEVFGGLGQCPPGPWLTSLSLGWVSFSLRFFCFFCVFRDSVTC